MNSYEICVVYTCQISPQKCSEGFVSVIYVRIINQFQDDFFFLLKKTTITIINRLRLLPLTVSPVNPT